MSRRVSFSPEEAIFPKHSATIKAGSSSKRATPKIWSFFINIGAKVSNALTMISTRRKCSGKVSSSFASLARSCSYAELALDSHRAEAIEDCIEFLNNPSLQRSSSVNSSC
ncbi:hypothetical protein CASFOL_009214 [Castilleja foliolosa]|uniref:Josephin-like protein n=1 Tax=Castilleja foliolosa TaxID=1961234 RepID=A0ABD3DWP5_9LAMI